MYVSRKVTIFIQSGTRQDEKKYRGLRTCLLDVAGILFRNFIVDEKTAEIMELSCLNTRCTCSARATSLIALDLPRQPRLTSNVTTVKAIKVDGCLLGYLSLVTHRSSVSVLAATMLTSPLRHRHRPSHGRSAPDKSNST